MGRSSNASGIGSPYALPSRHGIRVGPSVVVDRLITDTSSVNRVERSGILVGAVVRLLSDRLGSHRSPPALRLQEVLLVLLLLSLFGSHALSVPVRLVVLIGETFVQSHSAYFMSERGVLVLFRSTVILLVIIQVDDASLIGFNGCGRHFDRVYAGVGVEFR